MKRKLVDIKTPQMNPYNEMRQEEERERFDSARRNKEFLVRQAKRNPLSRDYYIGLKNLLSELAALEFAQKASEESVKYEMYGKAVSLPETSLNVFRQEMNKAKYLKMITGILETTGAFNIEEVISYVSQSLYAPKPDSVQSNKQQKALEQQTIMIKNILADYAKKLEQKEAQILQRVSEKQAQTLHRVMETKQPKK